MQQSCRSSDKRKFKLNNFENIINKTDIEELIKKQNYKCALSDLPLIPSDINLFPFKPSVDRIDNNKPHSKDNCQIVCLSVQFGKLTYNDKDVIDYINKIKIIN